jgi:NAD(P)H dehydrogenase (quinone)
MAIMAIVYHSGFGHTKLQAEAVHRGAASVKGIEAKLYTTDEATNKLAELDQAVPSFLDHRRIWGVCRPR